MSSFFAEDKSNMCSFIFDKQILCLTSDFYNAYPNPPYVEILRKPGRPYNCLLLQSHYDYFLCIPYRTEIKHKHAYKFVSSNRSVLHKSGLDYTKIVIVSDANAYFLDVIPAVVDADEYKETMRNISRIVKDANRFVEDYVSHCRGVSVLHSDEFLRRYQYSALKYFHNELHI